MREVYTYTNRVSASALGDDGREEFNVLLSIHKDIISVFDCPFCNTRLKRWACGHIQDVRDYVLRDWDFDRVGYILIICPSCGWYRYRSVDLSDLMAAIAAHSVALLSKVDVFSESAPIAEVRRYLSKHWDERTLLTPSTTEKLVEDIFKEHLDCETHYITNGVYTPDGGIDFVLVNSNLGIEYAFQVKRRLNDKPERIIEVREFIGALASSPYLHGYYVTTAENYTKSAYKEIKQSEGNLLNHNISVEIVDGTRLFDLLHSLNNWPHTAKILADLFSDIGPWYETSDSAVDHFADLYQERSPHKEYIGFDELLMKTFWLN